MPSNQSEQFVKLQDEVARLTRLVDAIQAGSSVNPEFVRTIESLTVSPIADSKDPATETREVDESGSSTFDVAKPMAGFIALGDYLLPYYNA